jgi:hypothetical protein
MLDVSLAKAAKCENLWLMVATLEKDFPARLSAFLAAIMMFLEPKPKLVVFWLLVVPKPFGEALDPFPDDGVVIFFDFDMIASLFLHF